MELIIIVGLIGGIGLLVSRLLASDRAYRKAELDAAWRLVLSDPDYGRRRLVEERKLRHGSAS